MRYRIVVCFSAVLTLAVPVVAQLPYNPTALILSPNETEVYEFAVQSSQLSFSRLDISSGASSVSTTTLLTSDLPFLSNSSQAFTPVGDASGISVLAGDCQDSTTDAQAWRFTPDATNRNGTWTSLPLNAPYEGLIPGWLSAGFTFSPTASTQDASLYVFGGMCPDVDADISSWTSDAAYSNTMLTLSTTSQQSPYQLSLTGARSPPIAEAGLTITPLSPVSARSSTGKVSQQQNFVLVGGHTDTAFINMSQVALFSLPEASWAFVGIDQPSGSQVEPRSGHTAVLSDDGSKIIVLGGWVGDVTNPAEPQLAVLNLGQGYGGSGDWSWTIPTQNANPFSTTQGVFGHGAVMLPGGVMMVAGGTQIGISSQKRSTTNNYLFFNVTSSTWVSTYTNPHKASATASTHASNNGSGMDSSQKAGLGAGLGLGLAAIVAVVIVWFVYARRLRQKRKSREMIIRELSHGAERFQSSPHLPSGGVDGRGGYPAMRSASWGSRQEQRVENNGDIFPWAPFSPSGNVKQVRMDDEVVDKPYNRPELQLDVPSPSGGLTRSLHSRGPAGFGAHFNQGSITGPGGVYRIDEVEEERSIRSIRAKTPGSISRESDPFKDPPNIELQDKAAENRKKEVQGWVDDWQSAAESMNLSRNPSQARTYSNLSQAHSSSQSSSAHHTGSVSPEKSDRTGSNLSERSVFSTSSSVQRSTGIVSRSTSQRSVSAGYSLFAGAAAAMSRLAMGKDLHLDRSASKRSVSFNSGDVRRRTGNLVEPMASTTVETQPKIRYHSPTRSMAASVYDYATPPESPIKDYKNNGRTSSMTSQGRSRTGGILGSMKRVLTGTSQVDVQATVETYEEKDLITGDESPLKPSTSGSNHPEMTELVRAPSQSNNANPNSSGAFWRGKKGAKDWNDDDSNPVSTGNLAPSLSFKRRSGVSSHHTYETGTGSETVGTVEYEGEDWDVETAIQKRVVQVMFTVPKEKLRVVNADSLSLISRSEVGSLKSEDGSKGKQVER